MITEVYAGKKKADGKKTGKHDLGLTGCFFNPGRDLGRVSVYRCTLKNALKTYSKCGFRFFLDINIQVAVARICAGEKKPIYGRTLPSMFDKKEENTLTSRPKLVGEKKWVWSFGVKWSVKKVGKRDLGPMGGFFAPIKIWAVFRYILIRIKTHFTT